MCLAQAETNEIYLNRLENNFEKIISEFENYNSRGWSAHAGDREFIRNLFGNTLGCLEEYEAGIVSGALVGSCGDLAAGFQNSEILETLPEFYKGELDLTNKTLIGKCILCLLNRRKNIPAVINLDQTLLFEGTLPLAIITNLMEYFQKVDNEQQEHYLVQFSEAALVNCELLQEILVLESVLGRYESFDLALPKLEIPYDVEQALGTVFLKQTISFIEKYHNDRILFKVVGELVELLYAINLHGSASMVKVVEEIESSSTGLTENQSCKAFSERTLVKINSLKPNQSLQNYLCLKLLIDLFKTNTTNNFFTTSDWEVLLQIIDRNLTDLGSNSLLRNLFCELMLNLLESRNLVVLEGRVEMDFGNLKMSLGVEEGDLVGRRVVEGLEVAGF